MSHRRWLTWYSGGLVVVALAAGCREASQAPLAPITLKPSFNASAPPPLMPGYVTVCKDTPEGTSGRFQVDVWFPYPDGTA